MTDQDPANADPVVSTSETAAPQGAETPAAPAGEAKPQNAMEAIIAELDADKATEPQKEPEPAPAEPAVEPEAKAPEAETASPDDDEDPELPQAVTDERVKRAFQRTKEKLKQARTEAQFGRTLAKLAADAKMSTEDLADWLLRGAALNKGDPRAVEWLRQKAGAYAPAQAPKQEAIAPNVEAIEKAIYEEQFAADVAAYKMDEDAARAAAKRIAAKTAKPISAPSQSEPVQQQAPQADFAREMMEREAADMVNNLDAQYAAKVKDWDKIKTEVYTEIAQKHKGAHPLQWVSIFNEVARTVQAKHRPAPRPAPVSPTQAIRPGVPAASSGHTDWKAELAAQMGSDDF